MGAFFSSFTGSTADCFCGGLQGYQVVLGGKIIFVIFYFRITNLLIVTFVSYHIPSEPPFSYTLSPTVRAESW